LALLYKIVTGHVAINPDQIGLVAADNRTRANNRYKFRAIGESSIFLRFHFGPFGSSLGATVTNFGISVLISHISSTGCFVL